MHHKHDENCNHDHHHDDEPQAPIRIAVTGAAGQIGYSLLFRLASGELFGQDTPIELNLLEVEQGLKGAEGTALELWDCAYEPLSKITVTSDPKKAFDGVHWALLIGSMPRGPGMERSDLIKANGPIFVEQGKALSRADASVRIVVVGNPCNTNALIAKQNCKDIPATRFSAMLALDENRAKAQIAQKLGCNVMEVNRMCVWGNHSSTMYPDFENAYVGDDKLVNMIKDRNWLEKDFISKVQNRGAEIISARGKSSAASAASAVIDHMIRFSYPTPEGDWFSAAVASNGEHYGVPKGIMTSMPISFDGDEWKVVEKIPLSAFAKDRIQKSNEELLKERDVVKDLL